MFRYVSCWPANDGRGLADGFVRRPAGHVPERRGPAAILAAHQSVLGIALHRAGRDLPPAERLRPPEGPHGRGRAADGLPRRRPASCSPPTPSRPTARSSSVEATFGLGEALVSGLVNADVYKVRDGEIVAKAIGTKQLAIDASRRRDAGTGDRPERQEQPALTDAQVVRLAQLGPADRSALRPPPGHRMVPASTMTSTSSRAGRSPRCSPSPQPTTERTTSTSPSVTSR